MGYDFRRQVFKNQERENLFGKVILDVKKSQKFHAEIDISNLKVDEGEVDESLEPTWVASALKGVNFAINEIRDRKGYNAKHIKITKVVGTVVDTTPGTIFCASVNAVANAFALPKKFFDYDFNGDFFVSVSGTIDGGFDEQDS